MLWINPNQRTCSDERGVAWVHTCSSNVLMDLALMINLSLYFWEIFMWPDYVKGPWQHKYKGNSRGHGKWPQWICILVFSPYFCVQFPFHLDLHWQQFCVRINHNRSLKGMDPLNIVSFYPHCLIKDLAYVLSSYLLIDSSWMVTPLFAYIAVFTFWLTLTYWKIETLNRDI